MNGKIVFKGDHQVGVEFPPQRRMILIDNRWEKPHSLYIPLPYMVFVVSHEVDKSLFKLSHLKVFFRKDPITSLDDELYLTLFSEYFIDSGKICLGSNPIRSTSVEELTGVSISEFWNTSFTGWGPNIRLIEEDFPSEEEYRNFYKKCDTCFFNLKNLHNADLSEISYFNWRRNGIEMLNEKGFKIRVDKVRDMGVNIELIETHLVDEGSL